jgi:hypothetical protein
MGNSYAQPIDPSRTAALQPGQIWVPTPTGPVAMTLPEARQYQSTHQYAVTDPNNPNWSPEMKARFTDPRIVQAIQQKKTGTIRIGDTDITLKNGKVVSLETGGHGPLAPAVWAAKHPKLTVGLMTLPVAGPYAYQALAGGGGAAGAGGTAAALGPSTPASIAGTSAVVGGSTVPASLAALTPAELAATGGAAAAGGAGAAAASAPTATTAGVGSTLKSWLTNPSVLTAGIGTAGSLIGAGIQSSGISKAAEIEAAVQREALQYEKQRDQYLQNLEAQRYGELNQRLQPYISTGQSASERMAQILGLPAPTPYTPSVPIPTTPAIPPGYDQRGPGTPGSYPTGVAVPRGGTTPNPVPAQLVMLRAPDGTQKQVPADQVAHYVSRGAQVIG